MVSEETYGEIGSLRCSSGFFNLFFLFFSYVTVSLGMPFPILSLLGFLIWGSMMPLFLRYLFVLSFCEGAEDNINPGIILLLVKEWNWNIPCWLPWSSCSVLQNSDLLYVFLYLQFQSNSNCCTWNALYLVWNYEFLRIQFLGLLRVAYSPCSFQAVHSWI